MTTNTSHTATAKAAPMATGTSPLPTQNASSNDNTPPSSSKFVSSSATRNNTNKKEGQKRKYHNDTIGTETEKEEIADFGLKADSPIFLQKMYQMINSCMDENVLLWSPDGKSFIIPNSKSFATQMLPQYFNHSNFSSFVRQLNFYNFQSRKLRSTLDTSTITNSSNAGTKTITKKNKNKYIKTWIFECTNFERGRPELLRNIKRRVPLTRLSKDPVSGQSAVQCTNINKIIKVDKHQHIIGTTPNVVDSKKNMNQPYSSDKPSNNIVQIIHPETLDASTKLLIEPSDIFNNNANENSKNNANMILPNMLDTATKLTMEPTDIINYDSKGNNNHDIQMVLPNTLDTTTQLNIEPYDFHSDNDNNTPSNNIHVVLPNILDTTTKLLIDSSDIHTVNDIFQTPHQSTESDSNISCESAFQFIDILNCTSLPDLAVATDADLLRIDDSDYLESITITPTETTKEEDHLSCQGKIAAQPTPDLTTSPDSTSHLQRTPSFSSLTSINNNIVKHPIIMSPLTYNKDELILSYDVGPDTSLSVWINEEEERSPYDINTLDPLPPLVTIE